MAGTTPKSEQIQFVSSKTGTHSLDTYLEDAEQGTKTLSEMLTQIFDVSGDFDATVFEFRVDSSTQKFQNQVSGGGWVDSGEYIFRTIGAYADATDYERLDIVTHDMDTYVANAAHTSSGASPDSNFTKIVNASLAKDWATKLVTTVDGSDYSAKYWATSADIVAVSGALTAINGLYADLSELNTVYGDLADINTLATQSANITTLAGISANITTVATNAASVITVAGISANITTVAGMTSDITNVLANETNINALAALDTEITALGAITTALSGLYTNNANITTLAGLDTEITALGPVSAAVSNLSSISAAVSTLSAISTDVTNAAANAVNINYFGSKYIIASNAPGSPTDGMLWYDTTTDAMKVYNGTSFVTSASFGSLNFGDLNDVSGTAPATNEVPLFNGTVYVPTAMNLQTITDIGAVTTNTISVATPTADGHATTKLYVDTAIADLLASAPGTLDTLNELAAALGDDPNFATTITASIATKLDKSGGTMSGDINAGDNKITNVTFDDYQETLAEDVSKATDFTVPNNINVARYNLGGDCDVTLPTTDNMPAGTTRAVTTIFEQDATGSRAISFLAPVGYSILWNNASSQPDVNPAANKTTIYTFTYIKGSTDIYASLSFYEG